MKPKIFVNRRVVDNKNYFHLEGGRQYFDSIINSLRSKIDFTNSHEEARIAHLFGGFIEPYTHRKIISTKPSLHSLTMSPPETFIKNLPRWLITRIYMRKVDRILTVSDYQKGYLERKGLKNVEKLGVFIDHNHFKPLKIRENEIFTVSYLGSLNKEKGAYELYKTIKSLENEKIIFNLAIRSCDKGLEGLFSKLSGIKNVVIHKNTDMVKFYNATDLIFLPFRTVYGTFPIPYALLEAMSCGKPVITTNIEPLKEIISDEKNGFLSDPKHFHEKILEITDVKTGNIGRNARNYIIKNHDKKPIIKKLVSIYEELL